jgi:hypothetical protein
MIGGIDIQIPTLAGESSLIAAARAIRQYWPNCTFENGSTGVRYESYWLTPFDLLDEVFVYRDAEAADVWDEEGAIPNVYNSMIHLISEPGLVTVVVDDLDDAGMKKLVNAISSALRNDILNMPVELEAV